MTDPKLTPDQEERVRRLLAEARHTGPMPPELVARFDSLIDGLARGEDVEAAPPAADPAVVPLAGRRRLRGVGALLVAAATITVLGVAGQQFTQGLSGAGDGEDAGSAALDAEADAGADSALESDMPEEGATERPTDGALDNKTKRDRAYRLALARQAKEVRSDRFREDALRLAPLAVTASSELAAKTACAGAADWSEGDRVPARYDGRLGALVYREATPEGQEVELFLCGVDGPVRTTTLPAPGVTP